MTRREAREQAFILIFEKSFQPDSEISELVEFADENNVFKADKYAVKLAGDTYSKLEEIDSIIENNLKGWSASRISKITRAILRMAVCEILFYDDVPAGAAINEAVELAKKFASDDEPAYINGVLGSIARSV
ncbi:MAG: transcription antitermination factor NusB [Acutalibacteraceae bacterium]|nr:transcription antitermination factor NusB [Oscillospiraceae bacterium]